MRHAGRSFLGFLSLASPFLIQTCTYMYFWTLYIGVIFSTYRYALTS